MCHYLYIYFFILWQNQALLQCDLDMFLWDSHLGLSLLFRLYRKTIQRRKTCVIGTFQLRDLTGLSLQDKRDFILFFECASVILNAVVLLHLIRMQIICWFTVMRVCLNRASFYRCKLNDIPALFRGGFDKCSIYK